YHTIEVDEQTQTDPLVCKEFGDIAEEFNCNVEDSEENRLFLVAFDALANEYSVRDLVEEFCGCKVFPVRSGWEVVAWNDFNSPIKVPDFARSFKVASEDIVVTEIEARANVILGPEDGTEYALIKNKIEDAVEIDYFPFLASSVENDWPRLRAKPLRRPGY
ncbi:unnamed protein product, partial [Urochloa humidicola]